MFSVVHSELFVTSGHSVRTKISFAPMFSHPITKEDFSDTSLLRMNISFELSLFLDKFAELVSMYVNIHSVLFDLFIYFPP